MPDPALAVFLETLEQATSKVPRDYFQLPVAGKKAPTYRERVYCYELYHQLRSALPHDFSFSLAGEIDKSGHPFIRTPPLNRRKPDFLVHSAGNMKRNLLAVEVKLVQRRVATWRKTSRRSSPVLSKPTTNMGCS